MSGRFVYIVTDDALEWGWVSGCHFAPTAGYSGVDGFALKGGVYPGNWLAFDEEKHKATEAGWSFAEIGRPALFEWLFK